MINWSTFETLPGSVTYNFEMLCRSLIWLNYGRFGTFKALLNQPGIEFELKLHQDCELGHAENHFGWQCKWYDLASGKEIGKTRRDQIEDGIRKTLSEIPALTDWVLWTRHPLTKKDQAWFYGLKVKPKLHLWTRHEAETLLNLNGEQLKRTYFGDLILTPEQLLAQHEQSVAPIKKRWFPQVHKEVDAERSLQRMLGRSTAWDELITLSEDLEDHHAEINLRLTTIPDPLKDLTRQFQALICSFADQLRLVHGQLSEGNFLHVQQSIAGVMSDQIKEVSSFPRKARGARLQVGLIATDALADLYQSVDVLAEVIDFLKTRLVGVVADAGGGKTQLAATLTAPAKNRPAGILLLGRYLHSGNSLDTLAGKVVVNGTPIPSMQALLGALNAAAERSKCILPIVIDGLNEAEDPREWKPLLSSLNSMLPSYPSVLFVCTLRSGEQKRSGLRDNYYYDHRDEHKVKPFVEYSLPENTLTFEIPDFGNDVGDAIDVYFKYFKIRAQPGLVYDRLLSHPLTLRIFCEVTNPSREDWVGMEAVPRSLAALFERYVDQASKRIEELAPRHNRYLQGDIINQLYTFGQLLWSTRSRTVNERQFRAEIGDDKNLWTSSAVNFMEQEGLLLRMPGKGIGQFDVVPTYDLLGGYIIAKYIISTNGRGTMGTWVNDKFTKKALVSDYKSQHPLREDIIRFLVALAPQYHGIQLWQVVNGKLRDEALEQTVLLEPKYLDKATLDAIAEAINASPTERNHFFGNLLEIHSTEKHPLNAVFLDSVLSGMQTGKRDLIWTEWLRRNEQYVHGHLDNAIARWSKEVKKRVSSDHLMAKLIMWMQTTTSHRMRYKATYALYWYARGSDNKLFDIVIESLSINDPYIPERTLAACYGAAMANATDLSDALFRNELLPSFAKRLFTLMVGKKAIHNYTHLLILEYSRGIMELAVSLDDLLFSKDEINELYRTPRAPKQKQTRKKTINPKTGESPFRMDFENYVIGRLVPGRRNYDYQNKDYEIVRSIILARIYELGWTFNEFGNIDRNIGNDRNTYNRHEDNEISKIDRYGKKYSWIAYYEQLGLMAMPDPENEVYVEERGSYADIDPSFPTPNKRDRLVDLDVLGDASIPLKDWVQAGEIPDLSIYLEQELLDGKREAWVLLDGHIGQQDEDRGRSMFGFFRAFFVASEQRDELVSLLEKQRLGGRWLPEIYDEDNAFAGEIPWSKHFGEHGNITLSFEIEKKAVEVEEEQDVLYIDDEPIELSWNDKLRLSGIDFSGLLNDSDSPGLSKKDLDRIEIRKELVTVKRTEIQYRDILVIQPTCNLRTPGKSIFSEFTGGTTLNKQLIGMLELNPIPQSRDLRDAIGNQATFQNSYEKKSFKNSERLFYFRKDLLDSLLKKLGMSLVWAVWGERELSLGQFEHWDRKNTGNEMAYADFKQIHIYPSAGQDKTASED